MIGKSRLILSPPVHQGTLCIAELRDGAVDIHSAGVAVPLQRVIVTAFWEKNIYRQKIFDGRKIFSLPGVLTGQVRTTSSPSLATNAGMSPTKNIPVTAFVNILFVRTSQPTRIL